MSRLAVLPLLAGCGLAGLDPYVDTDELSGSVRVDAVEPAWGPPEGGTAVTISGAGFDGQVQVWFGNAEVGATRLDAGTLLVSTPAAGVEATVDVTVRSELGEAVLEGGFTFDDDAPDDTDDTVDGTGLVGGMIEFSLLQIACPSCFGMASDLDVYANAAFHDPVNASWTAWLPAVGTCAVNPSATVPSAARIDVGEWVYLTSGSRSVGLRKKSGADGLLYEATGLGAEDYVRNASYGLSASDGGSIGAFDVKNALLTPQGFDSLTPVEMLYVDQTSAFAAQIRRSGQAFTWSPSGGGGTFVILIAAYSGSTGDYLGQALCRDADDGSMTVPGSALSAFPANSLLAIYLYRYEIGAAVLPGNGSTIESIATVGVLGTGVLK